jgi:hypothetical protein
MLCDRHGTPPSSRCTKADRSLEIDAKKPSVFVVIENFRTLYSLPFVLVHKNNSPVHLGCSSIGKIAVTMKIA